MQNLILHYLSERFDIQLTEQQRRAVETISGPVLLLAVPGAGKTTVMVARIANMIYCHHIPAESVLTITFSKAGAIDMKRRYHRLFSDLGNQEPAFCTIHSFCYQVVGTYCRITGGTAPRLIEAKERSIALRELYQRINGEFLSEDLEEELISNLSFIKNAMLKQEEAEDHNILETQIRNLWKLYQEYSAWKKKNALMDFDDMLGYTLTIFRRYPDILAAYQQRYQYICVDEAQDTSKLQYAVLFLLSGKGQKGKENNLFLVGDEDQSIYRFRGACPQTLLHFTQSFPNAQLLKMEENFRSTKQIVARANRFISFNKQRYPKNMFTQNEEGVPIEVKHLHDFSEQYHTAINAYLNESGTTAIIYRNHLSAIPMADILERNDIDFYVKEHKVRLKSNYVIGDILAFFSLSYDKGDFSAFSRIFYKTASCLKRNMLPHISQAPLLEKESFFDRMIMICDENQNTGKIRYLDIMIEQLKTMSPSKAMDSILYQIGYLSYLEYTSGAGYSMQAQKLNILTSLASRVKTVEEFLNRIDELDEVIAQHSEHNHAKLTLTTVHSAKGLEFDTVILLDCIDDVFPAHSAVEKWKTGMEEEMEEEARLFYVACTRAKKRLIIPYSNYSANNPVVPSRFVFRLTQEDEPDSQKGNSPAQSGALRLFPGLYIEHKNFGKGQVVSVDRKRGVFAVFFGSNGTRTLTLELLKSNTIRAIEKGEGKR